MRVRRLDLFLSGALAIQCAGAAGGILAGGSSIGSFLFLEVGLADPTSRMIDRGIACALTTAAIAVLVARRRPLFYLVAAWFALEALTSAYVGGFFGAALAPFARALRYGVPLAVAALLADRQDRAVKLLAHCSAAVFAAHGIEALLSNPRFIDYLIVTIDRATRFRMSESAAAIWLVAIGIVDVSMALLVVFWPSKRVYGYMAFWGFATALMRTVYYGPELGWHHTMIRVLNGAAPLALLFVAQAPGATEPSEEGMGQTWPEPNSVSR